MADERGPVYRASRFSRGAAWALLRLEVRASADVLVVCGGQRMRRFPWPEIRGFEVNQKRGNEGAVMLKGNAYQRLPIVDVATRKLPAEQARAELERYWRAHRR